MTNPTMPSAKIVVVVAVITATTDCWRTMRIRVIASADIDCNSIGLIRR